MVGIGCLILVTYRTLRAFFNGSKAVTIHINRYGEQYLDILSLIIIWIVCLVGLIVLHRILKEEGIRETMTNDTWRNTLIASDDTDIMRDPNIDSKPREVIEVLTKPSDDTQLYQQDD